MKKFGAILLVVVMLLSTLPMNAFAQTPEVTASGSCGDNLGWTLDENGLLVISGTGDMANWNFWDVSAPWLNYSEQISKVIIEEGVTSIGQNAFCSEDSYFDYNDHFYSALTEIEIPNTVTTIHTNGISGLDVLETITLPPSVTTLVGAAINNNYALKKFVVAEENPVYKDVDGVLFSKDGKTLVSYPIGATAESYTIPYGTKTIAAYAFSQCSTTLKEVIFNKELTFIDDEAFQNCDGLTSIKLPDSLKQLGGGVFQECSNLVDITLPKGMTRIGGRAFDCTGYYKDWSNWEDNVLYIGPYLLETTYVTPELDWEEWKEKSGTLNVRAGTTLIADESVDSSDVDAVVFNNGLQHIGFCAFGWLKIASISLPDSLISLGDWAFYNCELLEDIRIGSNLQYIGHDVFGNTPYDKADNYVDGVLYYGPYVLGFNDSLPNDVVLRSGTTLIAERAFWKEDGRLDSPDYGANMQSVTFPESLTTICDGAFYSCNNLKTLTIPSTVTYIGHQAYGWVKGYDLDIDEETFEKMTDVTIKGYNDTAAHRYATNNDITFVSLDEPVHEHTFKNSSHDNDNHWLECDCGEKENVTPHGFENACDTDCDCGYTREVTHNYNNLKYNDTHHWNECNCGAMSGYAEHKYDITKKTEDEHWRECACGKEEFPYHFGHGYSRVYDDDNHWLECECGVKEDITTHSFENACDTECDCGYIRTVTHNYDNLKYNDTHHWNECDCGAIDEENRYGHGYSRYTDKDSHWFECFCGHATEKESHKYDNVLDVDCNECGDLREITFTGWHQDNNGAWYYFENGNMVKNDWRQDSVGWVYLGKDGAMLTNAWCTDSAGWCYVGADGYAVTNCWKKDSIGWCYLGANGSQVKNNWILDGGKWYFINADGYMVSDCWKQDSVGWVYLGASGAMLTNAWCTDSQGWCYVGADGYAVTNCWKKDSIGWIWLNSNGSMTKSAWVKDGGKWYYLNANGYMVTGKQTIGGKTYIFNSSGVCTNP